MLIQEYKQSWANDFNQISNVINEALLGLQISIEHVGSTAVPDLAAKPIIDIDVVFDPAVKFDEIKIRLEKIGYWHNENQGIPEREVFKRAKANHLHEVLDIIGHHLYLCPADSEEFKKHILFRDYLIANEESKLEYESLKYKLAKEATNDKKVYAQLKEKKASEFINAIIKLASKHKGTICQDNTGYVK
jgi:GrpB-like predicted nucleotidyltransferase (UPF0157 family)